MTILQDLRDHNVSILCGLKELNMSIHIGQIIGMPGTDLIRGDDDTAYMLYGGCQ